MRARKPTLKPSPKPKTATKDQLNALVISLLAELRRGARVVDRVPTGIRSAEEILAHVDSEVEREAGAKAIKRIRFYLDGRYNPSRVQNRMTQVAQAVTKDLRGLAATEWQAIMDLLDVSSRMDTWLDADSQQERLFNEGRLYEALGKDDARTVLALWGLFHEVRAARDRIGWTGAPRAKGKAPETLTFQFRGSDLYTRMRDELHNAVELLGIVTSDAKSAFGYRLPPEEQKAITASLRVDPSKVDRHTPYQVKNVRDRILRLLDGEKQLRREARTPKRRKAN